MANFRRCKWLVVLVGIIQLELIIATADVSPEISYCLSKENLRGNTQERKCEPDEFISNSTLEYDSSHFLNFSNYHHTVVLRCTAPYPTQWLSLHTEEDKVTFYTGTRNNNNTIFEQDISLHLGENRILRCQSFSNDSLSAEIYLNKLESSETKIDLSWGNAFVMDPSKPFRVPCVAITFQPQVSSAMKLELYYKKGGFVYQSAHAETLQYNPSYGFLVEAAPNFPLIIRCRNASTFMTLRPLNSQKQIAGELTIQNSEHTGSKAEVQCNVNASYKDSVSLYFGDCATLDRCILKFKPYLIFRTSGNQFDLVVPLAQNNALVPSTYHGFIGCSGIKDFSGEYVEELDYVFTGLNGKKYLYSQYFPPEAIIELKRSERKRTKAGTSYNFECTINTFVLLPRVHFQLNYTAEDKPHTVIRASILSPSSEPGFVIASFHQNWYFPSITYRISGQIGRDAKRITCFAPWINASKSAEAHLDFEAVEEESDYDTNPEISYCLSPQNLTGNTEEVICEPNEFISNSTLEINSTHFLDFGNADRTVVLRCTAPYPLQWLSLHTEKDRVVFHPGTRNNDNTNTIFRQEISLSLRGNRIIRCQSFFTDDLSAEIYLNNQESRETTIDWASGTAFVIGPSKPFRVPCVAITLDSRAKWNKIKLGLASKFKSANLYRFTEVTAQKNYNPSYGFLVEEIPNFERNFLCAYDSMERLDDMLRPLNSQKQIRGQLSIKSRELGEVVCDVGEFNKSSVSLYFGACATLDQCGFKFQPYLIFRTSFNELNVVVHPLHTRQLIPSTNHGFIGCTGINDDTGEYIQEVDYMFTGVNGKKYLYNQSFPLEAIIKLKESDRKWSQAGTPYNFECTISTFVLLPSVHFQQNYTTHEKPRILTLERPDDRGYEIQMLAPDVQFASVTYRLSLELGEDTKSITCFAAWINASRFARASVNLGESVPHWFVTALQELASVSVSTITTIVLVVVLLVALVIIFVLWGRYNSAKTLIRDLTEEEINEFHYGTQTKAPDGTVPVEYLAFTPTKIIHSDRVIKSNEILGEGEYGMVWKGMYKGQTVAIKTTKNTADVDYFKAFLKEVKVMRFIGDNENIVMFHGAVVDKLKERICLAVVEYCPHGNLEKYLRKHAKTYEKVTTNSGVPGGSYQNFTESKLSEAILLDYCAQIANGMEFLASKKVVHGDLATRNVLVFDENRLKITDFGLSRKLYGCANYVKKKMAPLPWRWMSIEALQHLEFSHETDVWSYGVTAWEIFTLGIVPYAGLNWTTEFVTGLEKGNRLPKPERAPDTVSVPITGESLYNSI